MISQFSLFAKFAKNAKTVIIINSKTFENTLKGGLPNGKKKEVLEKNKSSEADDLQYRRAVSGL